MLDRGRGRLVALVTVTAARGSTRGGGRGGGRAGWQGVGHKPIGVPCHRPITTMTQRLIEGGLITSWLGDVVATRVREERQEGIHDQALAKLLTLPLESEEATEVVVGMAHLQAAFYILAACLALSCLVFLAELLIVSYCSNIPHFKDHPQIQFLFPDSHKADFS
ncbi:hypothetical protein GWK47_028305 [Chionoecetes opilio]|uniref:Uncharacterized protein n=1 Tax=Chionoecetes opilio TaxID=41210 RepID=A0A8J4YNS0_CHIOP|nr:hypothetical protein GWK47_028305 [Chionoecetes opilio]